MGDIGDEFCLQSLGLHPLLHRPVHPVADGVEVLRVGLDVPEHVPGVDFGLQVAVCQRLALGLALLELPGEEGGAHQQRTVQEEQEQQRPAVIVAPDGEKRLQNQQDDCHQHPAPGEREDMDQRPHAVPQGAAEADRQGAQFPADGVLPELPQFQPGGQGHEGRQHQQAQGDAQGHDQGQLDPAPGVQLRHHEHIEGPKAEENHQQQVQGHPVQPVGDNLVAAPAMARGAQQEHQHREEADDGENGQPGEAVPDGIDQLVEHIGRCQVKAADIGIVAEIDRDRQMFRRGRGQRILGRGLALAGDWLLGNAEVTDRKGVGHSLLVGFCPIGVQRFPGVRIPDLHLDAQNVTVGIAVPQISRRNLKSDALGSVLKQFCVLEGLALLPVEPGLIGDGKAAYRVQGGEPQQHHQEDGHHLGQKAPPQVMLHSTLSILR